MTILFTLLVALAGGALRVSAELFLTESQSCATSFSKSDAIMQIQYLDNNPFLCDSNFTMFQPPQFLTGKTVAALVALNGNCSLKQKISMTKIISQDHPKLRYLVLIESSLIDTLLASEDPEESISSNNVDNELSIVTVNRDCGDRLLKFIHLQSNHTLEEGGPVLFLRSDEEAVFAQNWQGIAQVVALMILSFSGSFLMAHILFSRLCPLRSRSPSRNNTDNQAERCLLSEACVEQFIVTSPESARALFDHQECQDGGDNNNNNQLPCCAVCLEEIVMPCKVSILPCGHPFHHECILPWLTERQACCPLCKMIVLEPSSDNSCSDTTAMSTTATSTPIESAVPTTHHESDAPQPTNNNESSTTLRWWDLSTLLPHRPSRSSPVVSAGSDEDLVLTEDSPSSSSSSSPSVVSEEAASITNRRELELREAT